ncbi:MAG: hypothetical protein ACRBN8_38625, partial [Nannocystales bacterium]
MNDMDAVGDCSQTAPPDSFEPDVQWEWQGDGAEIYVVVTPLVANLTDDDDNCVFRAHLGKDSGRTWAAIPGHLGSD